MIKVIAYILVSGAITVKGEGADDAAKVADERNKEVTSKNCALFTDCISKITQIENAKYIDVLMPMYNLIEYSDNYSKTSGSLWQYCRDKPSNQLVNSKSFKSEIKIIGNTPAAGNKIALPLTLIWMSFLGVPFEVRVGVKLPFPSPPSSLPLSKTR